jgi:hypothetical protein
VDDANHDRATLSDASIFVCAALQISADAQAPPAVLDALLDALRALDRFESSV